MFLEGKALLLDILQFLDSSPPVQDLEILKLGTNTTIVILIFINLVLAGISLRIGGYLAKGPYLPETLEGIAKTTKAVLGKN